MTWQQSSQVSNWPPLQDLQVRHMSYMPPTAPLSDFMIDRVKNGWIVTVRGWEKYVAVDYDGLMRIIQDQHEAMSK